MNKTKIEYADYTWNPVTGCTMGCSYCYARKLVKRFGKAWGYDFTPTFHADRLHEPLKLKKPSRIFVCDMGDLFDPKADLDWVMHVLDVIFKTPQHVYLFLSKRPERMLYLLNHMPDGLGDDYNHVWWGTTVTTQKEADERIPILLEIPAKVRWLSVEPMQERIIIQRRFLTASYVGGFTTDIPLHVERGMSGRNKKPFDIEWARDLYRQCKDAEVSFFMKQIDKVRRIPNDLMIREYPKCK